MGSVVALKPESIDFSDFLDNVLANSKPVLDQSSLVEVFRKAAELVSNDEVADDIMSAFDRKYQNELKFKGARDNQEMMEIFHQVADEAVGVVNVDKLKRNVEVLHDEKVDGMFRAVSPKITRLARALFDELQKHPEAEDIVKKVAGGKLRLTISNRDPLATSFFEEMFGRHSSFEYETNRVFLSANEKDVRRPDYLAQTFLSIVQAR